MLPLDLTSAPPRSAREQLDGLYLMPRTIDKLRAQLPGGKTGTYLTHEGFSKVLLLIIHVEEEPLREAVAAASSDEDVAAWLRQHADPARFAKANAILPNLTDADVTDDLRETFDGFYAGRPPELKNLFDILDWDDRRNFSQIARPL